MAEPLSRPQVIACTLSPLDFKARLTAIAQLNDAALLNHRQDDLRLELTYAVASREQVLEMVRAEQACCAFLAFDIHQDGDVIRVVIDAPESARVAVETIFQHLHSRAARPLCGCGGSVR